jgi:hypothetical protein
VPIAPSTYYDVIKVSRRVSEAELREEKLMLAIARVHHANYSVFGSPKPVPRPASARSATRWTTPWPRPRSGCSKPN